ncbi:MAG: glycosyltransferase family 1 protein [Gaiellales bacterium]|nr:glycosyltransferase family 1 protein [Gaiellales bacterium]
MPKVHKYTVRPVLPPRIAGLRDMAYNMAWTWNHDTIRLFQRLDAELWDDSNHNPIRLLGEISQEKLDGAAQDEGFLAAFDRSMAALEGYMSGRGWCSLEHPEATENLIAYFSMEYGIAESIPIYSGGLGVLSGDHLKSASDLALPLVAVGLLYKEGYFTQYLNPDGWQLERYAQQDFDLLPVKPVAAADGSQLRISVDLAGTPVSVGIFKLQVGRIPLYLLSTHLPENAPVDREVTDELYGGGPEERIRQEIVLGIGGFRALRALGLRPAVCHMNEGHSAFLSLERARQLMQQEGLTYWEARQVIQASTLFTTHTPVPAGFDLFSEDLMRKYFGAFVGELGLKWDEFMDKGRSHPGNAAEAFNVAVLALRHAPRRNAVSRLHRRVTARMISEAWQGLPDNEIPVESVTNGVHSRGWVSADMAELLDRYLGPRWRRDVSDAKVWARVSAIPDEELWRAHERQRERLVTYARSLVRRQLERRHASRSEGRKADEALRSDILTVGFARRFATYKRGNLILREVDRLKALLLDEHRPMQIIFSGKAHPRDDSGKALIRDIVHFSRQEGLQHRIVFLEDYDLAKARMLVRGVDVWLNTPRRPLEASGTSGMKVLINGGLNLSVLDGWWAEGYREEAGWAIGSGEEDEDLEKQDRNDALSLYSLLEEEVIPLFYQRGPDGLPREWIRWMKNSMRYLTPAFSTVRMVREYAERFYVPAGLHYQKVIADGFSRARALTAWKARLREHWADVRIVAVRQASDVDVPVGGELLLEVQVALGALTPDDVQVVVYYGLQRPDGAMAAGRHLALEYAAKEGEHYLYRGAIPAPTSGPHGYQVGVLPFHDDALVPNELSLITWE